MACVDSVNAANHLLHQSAERILNSGLSKAETCNLKYQFSCLLSTYLQTDPLIIKPHFLSNWVTSVKEHTLTRNLMFYDWPCSPVFPRSSRGTSKTETMLHICKIFRWFIPWGDLDKTWQLNLKTCPLIKIFGSSYDIIKHEYEDF